MIALKGVNTRPRRIVILRVKKLFHGSLLLLACFGFAATVRGAVSGGRLYYGFDNEGSLEEAGSMSQSSSRDWWVNSGGYLIQSGGIGSSVQGELPANDRWRLAYAASNPTDTDGGYHPQNIFRLVTKSQWRNLRQQVYFKISKTNLSSSPNRNAYNGVLLFNRYVDSNNLYYVGLRVDGAAVIKKKLNGKYYTLGYYRLYGSGYDPTTKPNLLPANQWIGLRSVVKTNPDNSVTISVYVDNGDTKGWTRVLESVETGTGSSGPAILAAGYAGVRTDFMDVQFDGFETVEVP